MSTPCIMVGRFGYRGAKPFGDSDSETVVVDCRSLEDPCFVKGPDGKVSKRKMRLEQMKAELLRDQYHKTMKLSNKVVEAVVAGKNVCVKCMMGKNRSQCVVSIALDQLKGEHNHILFQGPVYLGNIVKTK